jgi:alpha-galactosidase
MTPPNPPKIVIIGAGSVIFGLGAMATLIRSPRLRGAELGLVDINEAALETVTAIAQKMNTAWDANMTIRSSTRRVELLPGADFVIVSVQVGERETVWEMDWQIPLRHGIRQPYAENGGPGSIAHTFRNLPLILDIAYDMERLCPDAWYINLVNPLIRLTQGVHRYTNLKVLGLCHQLLWGYAMAGAVLADRWGIPIPDHFHVHTDADNLPNFIPVARAAVERMRIKAAGINHFSWIYDIRDKATGEDLYPLLRESWFNGYRRDFEPLTREMFDIFGLMPTPGDSHLCEFLPFVVDPVTKPWEKYDLKLQSWDGNRRRRAQRHELAQSILSDETPIEQLRDMWQFNILEEPVAEMIEAITYNENTYFEQLNIPNTGGLIPNLPSDAIVEVPGVVSGYDIQGLGCPPLPDGIAALCRRELELSGLVIEAAATGDRRLALQALLLDPMVRDIDTARALLDDFLREFAEFLPQFA